MCTDEPAWKEIEMVSDPGFIEYVMDQWARHRGGTAIRHFQVTSRGTTRTGADQRPPAPDPVDH